MDLFCAYFPLANGVMSLCYLAPQLLQIKYNLAIIYIFFNYRIISLPLKVCLTLKCPEDFLKLLSIYYLRYAYILLKPNDYFLLKFDETIIFNYLTLKNTIFHISFIFVNKNCYRKEESHFA